MPFSRSKQDNDVWIRARPTQRLPWRGIAQCGGRRFPCALGLGGIVAQHAKREGDAATPAGDFPLRQCLYRAARVALSPRGMRQTPILPLQFWCEDPASRCYNRLCRTSQCRHAGGLWRADSRFDVILIPGHNDAPPIPGKGSGIFIHAAPQGLPPTSGCVGLLRKDLIWLARQLDSRAWIHIQSTG